MKHIIKRALEPNYTVERADEINQAGTIIAQIVERVFNADLVVADLTGKNANVFYEVAIRHATRKPTVHLAATGDDPPFDVNQIRLIKYNLADPDSVEDARHRLSEQVKGIEAGEEVTTPVQFAQILHSLETGDSRDKQLLEVFKGLSQGMETLQEQVSHIDTVLDRAPFGDAMMSGLLGTTGQPTRPDPANSIVTRLNTDFTSRAMQSTRKELLSRLSRVAMSGKRKYTAYTAARDKQDGDSWLYRITEREGEKLLRTFTGKVQATQRATANGWESNSDERKVERWCELNAAKLPPDGGTVQIDLDEVARD
jgi:hypothetical protein